MNNRDLYVTRIFIESQKLFIGCFEYNIDFLGNDWFGNEIRNLPSAELCQEKCFEDTKCKVFTYAKQEKRCWLKESDSGRRPKDGYVSGRKYCPGSSYSSGKRLDIT